MPDALPADAIYPLWAYEQATGELWRGGQLVAQGYSGRAEGKNQPDMEAVKNTGPIPRGFWRMGEAFRSPTKGPLCIPLTPIAGTETYGRSGFLIHGDSIAAPGTASEGCIVLPRAARDLLAESSVRVLEVVPRLATPMEMA